MPKFSLPPASMRSFLARLPGPILVGGGLVGLALLVITLLPAPGERASTLVAPPASSAATSAPAPTGPAAFLFPLFSTTQARQQIKFVTSFCRDRQGRIWIGTEDVGLWRYDPNAPVAADYVHFAAADGPGDDNIYALACDKSGRIWAGTLNHGVAVFNGRKWGRYAPPDGPLGCHVTALAVNPISGGVWMATEAGLARYEQKHWTCYTHANGLVSDHATALAFAPNGTLYVGTECDGIAIGSLHDDYKAWRTVPGPASPPAALRGAGLPSGMINCLIVTRSGEAWAGTTAGLAHSGDSGRTWRFRRGGDWKDKASGRFTTGLADQAKINGIEVLPASGSALAVCASGRRIGRFKATQGFTGGQVEEATQHPIDTTHTTNAAPQAVYQVDRYGDSVFTASHLKPSHLCRVRLHFAETYFSGAGDRVFDVSLNGKRVLDHLDIFKAAGGENRALVREFAAQADAQGCLKIAFQGASPGWDQAGLGEDYVTCLADDDAGHLLVGHRQQSPQSLDLKTGVSRTMGPTIDAAALLPLLSRVVLGGGYGEGLSFLPVKYLRGFKPTTPALTASPLTATALPAPAPPPALAQLNRMLAEVNRVPAAPREMQPHVTALADDWQTEGEWLGRYGRYWAVLAAFFHPIPADYLWGAGWTPVDYNFTMGPNRSPGDSLRYWLQWRYTDNPRVLEMPAAYTSSRVQKHYTTWNQDRRETEVDDHGESYPATMEGPNVYATLAVPEGLFYLSLYDYNKLGHDDFKRFRDFRLSVRVHNGLSLEDVAGFPAQPELANGRIRNFWGGVWKRYLVRGPLTLTVEVNRNYSFDTMLPAVMLDLVDESPAPYFRTVAQWNVREAADAQERRFLTRHPEKLAPAQTEAQAASLLFDKLNEKRLIDSAWWATEGRRCYAALLRWYTHNSVKPPKTLQSQQDRHLATCEYQIGCYSYWEKWQQAEGLTTARQIEQSLRWDGVTNSYSGLGYQIVSTHQSRLGSRLLSQAR